MKRIALVAVIAAWSLCGQQAKLSESEQDSLTLALGEAGNSPVEFIRALEHHLKQYPNSSRRVDLERALYKTAVDLNDDRRVVQYGESELRRGSDNLAVLEHVTTSILRIGDKAGLDHGLEYALRIQKLTQAQYGDQKFIPGGGKEEAKRKDDADRALARSNLLLARAHGLLGHNNEAVQLAEASYKVFPSVEAAREAARWLSAAGKDREAIQYLADAFTIVGLRATDGDAATDRVKMGELYRKVNGSDAGLGDTILKAYDNTSAALTARRNELRSYDPNVQVKDPMNFTLSGLDGEKLAMSSLLGKVVVLDFWATWCGPCRAQHPLYEEVKARFKDTGDVVFLSIDTDDDHSLVKPFIESIKWTQKVYFEDGLSNLLQVSSIPTTVIFGKRGEMVNRMVGYLPDRFVDMLTDRIDEALGRPSRSPKPPQGTAQ